MCIRDRCDGMLFSASQIKKLKKTFEPLGIKFIYSKDVLSPIWKDRTPLPSNKVFEHKVKYAGKSRAKKLAEIRKAMKAKNVDHHLVATLDDIAWIFNIRSSDVECNPVSIAYAIISHRKTYLFIDTEKVPTNLRKQFQKDGIVLKPYNSIEAFLKKIPKSNFVLLDAASINMRLYDALDTQQIVHGKTISTHLKGIKNKTEIEHIKNAMIKDGVALTKLYMWLENLNKKGDSISEAEVAVKLDELRRAQGDYFGESFSAIVGWKGNGAIVHLSLIHI